MPYARRQSANAGGSGIANFPYGADIEGIANLETCKIGGVSVSAANASLADVTATAAELNSTTGDITAVTFVVSASSAIQTITMTIKDANAATIADARVIKFYLATAATGLVVAAAANGTVAPTTGTILKAHTAKLYWELITDVNGVAVMSIDNTGGTDHLACFGIVVLPNGNLTASLVTDVRSS